MTCILGDRHRNDVVIYRHRAGHTTTPFPGLCLLVIVQAVIAFLYVVGLMRAFPRSGQHDAILVSFFGLSFAAGLCWEAVKQLPFVGKIVYALPGLALMAGPFVLDFYLIARR